MLNRLLRISLLIFSVLSLEAHAGQVSNPIPECQRVSKTGAVFTCDISVPALGEAYRDPSGLIWGSIVMAQGKVNAMTQYSADKYCKDVGARLPTKEEFEQLAKYLGKGTSQGYSPYLADGKTDFLPGLTSYSNYKFWSSSVYPTHGLFAFVFHGYTGDASSHYYRDFPYLSVRCVADR